jgi:CRISPR-associated exonuclease Cas4
MQERIANYIMSLLLEISLLPEVIIMLVVLLVMGAIVLDSVFQHLKQKKSSAGLSAKSQLLSVDGVSSLPLTTYVSDIQGLSGRPDALIKENGFIIPIERKPLAKKLRDRYVAQLLVYMRLVEEFEGKKPPYGYLILGPNCRRVKVNNTDEKQAWLQKIIDEMREVLRGQEAKATPHPNKCSKCDVKDFCSAKNIAAKDATLAITNVSKTKSQLKRIVQ